MYFCLSLGFQGQYRLSPRGPAELDRVREDLYALIIRQRGAREAGLSPHWQGVDAPYKPRRGEVPLWVGGAAALAILGGIFLWMTLSLNTASDNVMERLLAAPPIAMPQIARQAPVTPPPPPAEPGALTACAPSSPRKSPNIWSVSSAPRRCRWCASAAMACSPPAAPIWNRNSQTAPPDRRGAEDRTRPSDHRWLYR